ncbi:hypothetical protein AQUCO_01700480v1 [Aquilegia coerulea]|uniref:Uncharacterized protein n=1 Tax=Aquilegia coerulea TaxID=218851 RepID=A0A2G5DN78_AQUCA|nr:hypothetical protein AQUCO_01700480v1 [Aquilegia coerulea]
MGIEVLEECHSSNGAKAYKSHGRYIWCREATFCWLRIFFLVLWSFCPAVPNMHVLSQPKFSRIGSQITTKLHKIPCEIVVIY